LRIRPRARPFIAEFSSLAAFWAGCSVRRPRPWLNPLGFTLEHFDALGRYRKEEKGKPIDAAGSYETRSGGQAVKFGGALDLAAYLTSSGEAHSAFVQQLFHYLIKQPIGAFGSQELPDLRRFFVAHDFNIRKLMVEIMASTALTPRGQKL
jgi:hypothetical protein